MPYLTLRVSGLAEVRVHFAAMRVALGPAILRAVDESVREMASQLASAAPVGNTNSDTAPAGDAPGRLADSFVTETTEAGTVGARGVVRTTQPTKLLYVRKGTGIYGPSGQRITPRTARALFWEGAAHPVASVKGMQPNDFVTPVLEHANEVVLAQAGIALSEALTTA